METTAGTEHGRRDAFRHDAFVYAGLDQFVAGTASFIRASLAAEEPILVVVAGHKLDALREELDGDSAAVCFADMAEVGANPARIIPAWRDFVGEHARPGRRLRGIGEPIGPERGAAELTECHRHEALLNVAFADTPGFWLMCPYDTDALDPAVVADAHKTHPIVVEDGVARASRHFPGPEVVSAPFEEPLPEPPAEAEELPVHIDALSSIRRYVSDHATRARMTAERAADFVIAVNEVATNTVRHGGGEGSLRIWREPGAVVCEVRDTGRILHPLAGRERPVAGQIGGYGLWLANQICDLVQVRAFPAGGAVRLHMRLR